MEGTSIIRQHLPLITGRIIFTAQVSPDPPAITPRIDFNMEDLNTLSPGRQESDVDDAEETPSELTDIEEELEDNEKILKPPGEAGRPGSGGYNLKEELGWSKAEFDKVQVSYVYDTVNKLTFCLRNMSAIRRKPNSMWRKAMLVKNKARYVKFVFE
jgi:hypothetical protein